MDLFFLFLELMIPLASGYLILKKGSLAIVYIPFLLFSSTLFEETKYIPGNFYFYLQILLLLYFVFFNIPFVKRNVFSVTIVIYYFYLFLDVEDIDLVKRSFVGVMWLFVGIPLIPEIYKNYSRTKLFNEVSNASFLMMSLFVVNVIFSTYFNYNPKEIYGIKTGVLFGKMSSDIYNIFPFAIFVIFRKSIKNNDIKFISLYFISMFLILLTMRRSVMALSLIGTLLVLIELVRFEEIKKFVIYGIVILVVSLVVIYNTSFVDQFIERFEQRGLDDRKLEDEQRLAEWNIIYKDLFVFYDYDPWLGFGLFNSNGNYGKKVFGDRTLHTDLTNIIHSSGIIGLFLYLLMFGLFFLSIWRKTNTRGDYIQFFFLSFCFLVFFINGRYTTTSAMILMLSIFSLPFGKGKEEMASGIKSKLIQ